MQNVVTRNGQTETSEENFEELFEQYLQKDEVKEGEITKGRVIRIGKEFVVVDIDYKSEGQIPIDEFIGPDGKVFIKEGDFVDVFVDAIEDDDGLVELSKEKADKLKIWDEISLACERDELVEGVITSRVKGGLTVDIGVKAFLPGSQVDLRPVRNLDKYIGQTYQFKVIKFNKRRGNIVLSRRALLEKERAALKAKTLETLEVGKNVKGIVKNITEYGCFVDLGGIDGLLHITDMSWGRINHPSEMFEVGDEVEVKVLKFDAKTERVSLGLKQITEDPWIHADQRYNVGDKVKGKVVSLTDYGAFVELEEGIEGLIHISELSREKVENVAKVLTEGQRVRAKVINLIPEERKIGLSLRRLQEGEESEHYAEYLRGQKARSSTRLGDLLKDKLDLAKFEGEERPEQPAPAPAPRREVIEAPGNLEEE